MSRTLLLITLSALFSYAAPEPTRAAEPKAAVAATDEGPAGRIVIDSDLLRYVIGSDGANRAFIDKASGKDYFDASKPSACAHVSIAGKTQPATGARLSADGIIHLTFGTTGAAAIRPRIYERYVVMELVSADSKAEWINFVSVPLTLAGSPGEPFAACAMALDLQTNVEPFPQPTKNLSAVAYSKFGFAGAEAAIVACPIAQMRPIMQDVVSASPELPKTKLGGPWALDAEINRGSYLFNFFDLTEQTADEWIGLAKALGMTQIDFHGGNSFRFGDCRPNPKLYPDGYAGLKRTLDKLHAAGIKAGLHTYAFFIAKDTPWVTPVPDPRLASDATFTLAADVTAEAAEIGVVEDTKNMSTITGFFERNSVTLRIDEELIIYTGVRKESPFAFNGCKRGAHGTKVSAHPAGTKAHHLKECFGLFLPDGDSTMLAEVAAKTAEAYNTCGFDMMYLDALDGEDTLGGPQWSWHYGSKFVFELIKRVEKDPVMEMSTFHHHLWYARSRAGAWDHPNRSHKRFIDTHVETNRGYENMFLPAHLGWWAVKTWTGIQNEPTFSDDIEYLCGKCIGHGEGFSIMGVEPATLKTNPAYQRLAGIMKNYETLRHAGHFEEKTRALMREPGKEFHLSEEAGGGWKLQPAAYDKHKVLGLDRWSNHWTTLNPFESQPLKVRIEVLMSAAPYDDPKAMVLLDAEDPKLSQRKSAAGVELKTEPSTEQVKAGSTSLAMTATAGGASPRSATWAMAGRTYGEPMNLVGHEALGMWVHGDGSGQVLNVQLTSSDHITRGIGDHYIPIDFTGWRYCELLEPEGERWSQYVWPYGGAYSMFREHVEYSHIANMNLWVNHLPADKPSTCYISSIKGLPLVSAKVANPTLTVNGRRLPFEATIESGSYVECYSPSDCKIYGPNGALLGELRIDGELPELRAGENTIEFTCDGPTDVQPRVRVTVISYGPKI